MSNFNQQIMKGNMRRNNDNKARLEIIRAACIKANNDIVYRDVPFETIRLADVLLAYGDTKSGFPYKSQEKINNTQVATVMYITSNWNLRRDSLEEQSEETLQFLADLLTH